MNGDQSLSLQLLPSLDFHSLQKTEGLSTFPRFPVTASWSCSQSTRFSLFLTLCPVASFKAPRASLVAQMVKNLPVMQETLVRSLGWKDTPGGRNGNVNFFLNIPTDFPSIGVLFQLVWGVARTWALVLKVLRSFSQQPTGELLCHETQRRGC